MDGFYIGSFPFSLFHFMAIIQYNNNINNNTEPYQVLRILAWDTLNHLVYYLGTQDKKPGQQHLYIVKDPVIEDPRR